MGEPDIQITLIGGFCPVQAEGTVDGVEFYFRARHAGWRMNIGGEDVVLHPAWTHRADYGEGPDDAGFMPEHEARKFIAEAAELWARRGADDGQPDEAQEWADYDPDC